MCPTSLIRGSIVLTLLLVLKAPTWGDEPQSPAKKADASLAAQSAIKPEESKSKDAGTRPLSFIRDVAPVLVRNCIACHNPKKSESKYVMTTFAQLAKGGKQGEGMTIVPGKSDESYFIDVILEDADPRMPYKLDSLPQAEIKLLEKWVAEGAKYDGTNPGEDWTFLLRKTQLISIPEAYPVTVPITALAFSADGQRITTSGYHEIATWKTADGALKRRTQGLAERTYSIAFSPDGKWLATASGEPGQYGLARLWSAEPGGAWKPVRDLGESQDVVFAATFSPDGRRLATAGADRIVRVFETETGKLVTQIEDHADWIFDV